MSAIDLFVKRARSAKKTLVLPEGMDPRVIVAANMIIENGVAAEVTVLGTPRELEASCKEAGITERKFKTLDHLTCDFFEEYAAQFCELRKKKGISLDDARKAMRDRLRMP